MIDGATFSNFTLELLDLLLLSLLLFVDFLECCLNLAWYDVNLATIKSLFNALIDQRMFFIRRLAISKIWWDSWTILRFDDWLEVDPTFPIMQRNSKVPEYDLALWFRDSHFSLDILACLRAEWSKWPLFGKIALAVLDWFGRLNVQNCILLLLRLIIQVLAETATVH